MARNKTVSHNNMPEVIGQIWDFLQGTGTGGQVSPEIAQRLAIIEKKLDYLAKRLSPDRPTMNKQATCRLLKLRPKQLLELELSGVLTSHSEGNKTVFYEDDVMRCYAKQFEWRNALEQAAKPADAEPAAPETEMSEPNTPYISSALPDVTGRIGMNTACEIVGRNPGAVYQLITTKSIPSYKDGRNVYFDAEELREWVKAHPPRKYRRNEQK